MAVPCRHGRLMTEDVVFAATDYRLLDTSPENRGAIIEELRQEVGPIGSLVIIKGSSRRGA